MARHDCATVRSWGLASAKTASVTPERHAKASRPKRHVYERPTSNFANLIRGSAIVGPCEIALAWRRRNLMNLG
jgi:hypothetical protein